MDPFIAWESDDLSILHHPRISLSEVNFIKSFLPNRHIAIQTSGSSGPPKWVALSKEAVLNSAKAVIDFYNLAEKDSWLLAIPSYHIGGASILARSFVQKAPLFYLEGKWSPYAFQERLAVTSARNSSIVPTQLFDIVKASLRAPKSLHRLFVGGDRLAPLLEKKGRCLGWPLIKTYGMSEAASQVASERGQSLKLQLLPHLQARVEPEGTLSLRGSSLFSGYITKEGIHSPLVDGWYLTKDKADLDPVTRIITLKGRSDDAVKVSGRLVHVHAIQALIDEVLATVRDAPFIFIKAEEDLRLGHQLILSYIGERPDALIKKIEAVMPHGIFFSSVVPHEGTLPGKKFI